jgi:hypothetical protein
MVLSMNKSIGTLLGLLTAAGLLAACTNYNNNVAPIGTGSNCGGPPSANQLEVLFPKPNARRAPATLGNIYVSTKGQLPPSNSFNFLLVQSNGAQTFTSVFFGINKGQIPSPHATPSYANPIYYATSLPSGYFIGPSQTVNLIWNDGGTGCTPHSLVASFKTSN